MFLRGGTMINLIILNCILRLTHYDRNDKLVNKLLIAVNRKHKNKFGVYFFIFHRFFYFI